MFQFRRHGYDYSCLISCSLICQEYDYHVIIQNTGNKNIKKEKENEVEINL